MASVETLARLHLSPMWGGLERRITGAAMTFAGLPALLLLPFAQPVGAEVTLPFYAHPGARVRDSHLLFPHTFVQATGSLDDTGDVVGWLARLTARDPGPQLLLVRGVGVVDYPDPRYVGEGKALFEADG